MSKEIGQLRRLSRHVYARRGPAKAGMWKGIRALKYPTDLFLYAEMIYGNNPEVIIETGTRFGGSALFLADICEIYGRGHVITVEIDNKYEPVYHDRLTCLRGDSVSDEILEFIEHNTKDKRVMIILDSDHSAEHIYNELKAYSKFLKRGDYIIVEDASQEGGQDGVNKFLKKNIGYYLDKHAEKYGIHCAKDGFIRKL